MLRFLDVIITPQDWERINLGRRKAGLPEFQVDTAAVSNNKPAINTAHVDSVVNNGVADSITNKEGVVDTIKASFINGTGGGDDTTTLICTALVIIAALALCFCFIRLYRQSWQKRASLA